MGAVTRVDEGFVDRGHEHVLCRTIIENVGPVLVLSGPRAPTAGRLADAGACAWVPSRLALRTAQWPEWMNLDVSVAWEYLPGVSLLSLLAQARASRRFVPVQAAAVAVHDAALGFEAVRRAGLTLGLRLEPLTPLSVRVGFRGDVQVIPLPNAEDAGGDTSDQYVMANFLGSERGVDLGSAISPEAAYGLPLAESEAVFHLGALLVTSLRGRVVGGAPTDSMLDQLQRLAHGVPPSLPADVPDVLRDLIARSVCHADRRLPDLAQFTSALRQAFNLADGRVALAAHVQALFPQERRAQEAFVLEGREQSPTRPNVELQSPRVHVGTARLQADARLVTHGDFTQFLSATAHPRPESFVDTPELRDQPVMLISHADAGAYARWRGGRIPTDHEWTLLSTQSRCRDLGRAWEWTVDREEGGWVVRGGPWRNQSGPGLPDHRSWERAASPDVGFRCVYDVED